MEWTGLADMAFDLKVKKASKIPREVSALTKDLMNMAHQVYVDNLSGAVPSTAARPLPVGVRTGKLRAGAHKRQVNQWSCEVTNDVEYAGFIEVGTQHMAARRPLGNAVDTVERMVPGKLNDVMTTIVVEE